MSKLTQIFIFIVVLAATAYGFYSIEQQSLERIYKAAIEVCEEQNIFREKVSNANEGFIQHNDITSELFSQLATTSEDKEVRKAFRQAVPVYQHITHFYEDIQTIDCYAVIEKP